MDNLLELIKQAGLGAVEEKKPVGFLVGNVKSISPLEIEVEQKLLLTEEILILTKSVMDYKTEITFDDFSVKQTAVRYSMDNDDPSDDYRVSFKGGAKHKITVYNGLKVGDCVLLMKVQGGQKFVVLERVGAIDS